MPVLRRRMESGLVKRISYMFHAVLRDLNLREGDKAG
jgi:hypothetical protein